ncbi:MAG: H/ACA ribonucleoprotein complex non-core subunit naf1 [Marteilia pararefringens]
MDEEMNCLYDSEVSDDEDDDDDEQLSINFENIKDLFDPEASAYGERFINDSAAEIEEDYLIACKPLENCVDADSSCKLNRLGQTCSIYKNMAIVSSTEAINRVLREGTDIFDSDGHFIGRVVEIFGNVQCPMYAVQLKEEKLNDIDQSTMSLYYQSDSASAPFMHLQNEIDRSTATDA